MDTENEQQQEAKPANDPAPEAKPQAEAEQKFESHDPTCEACDEPAEKSDPPVTGSKPFRRGLCKGCSSKKVGVKRSPEHWAKAKGMLPRILEQGGITVSGKLRAAVQNPKHADFHRARAFKGWHPTSEVTEAEFDQAVKESATPTFR